MTIIKRTNSEDADFRNLVALLDEDLAARDGDEHSFYAPFNTIVTLRNAMVCYDDNEPVACGAFKAYDNTKAEIKRMFVQPAHRGKGIGLDILEQLERWASELGFHQCILETGKRQPEAIRLYEKAGYTRIKNYGQYENVENSVCMQKIIT